MSHRMSDEDRERFATRVVRLADMFNRLPSQYDSLIVSYWDSLHDKLTIDEFESVCDQLTREMYTLPVPKQIIDLAFRTKDQKQEQKHAPDLETVQQERILYEGQNILKVMDEGKREALYRAARLQVLATLGPFTSSEAMITGLTETKAAQMAWERENGGRK